MCIDTRQKDGFQVIRFVSDFIMESDMNTLKDAVEGALQRGTRNFVFSVSIGSLTNQMVVSKLLRWCKDTIQRGKGNLFFIEKDSDEKCVFRRLCDSLHIPIYQNLDTTVLTIDKTKAS